MHWICMSVEELERIISCLEYARIQSDIDVSQRDEIQKLIDKIKYVLKYEK